MKDRPRPKPPDVSPPDGIDSPAYTDCNGRVWTWGRWFVLNFYQQILVTRGLNPYTALELTGDEETSHRQEDNIRGTPGSTGSNESSGSSNAERAGVPENMNQPSTSGVATQTVPRIDVRRTAETPATASQMDSEAGTSAGPLTSSALPISERMVNEESANVTVVDAKSAMQNANDVSMEASDENLEEQETEEEETSMEGIETPLREVLVVLHVNDSELVLGTATEITTDAQSVPVPVTIETSEDIPDDSFEPQSSNGEQRSTSTAPIVENRTIELKSEHLIRADNQLGMGIVEQTTEGVQPNVNVTNNDSSMEIGGEAPVARETEHGDDIAVAASSQIHETTDSAQAHTPEQELMEVTNEGRRRGEKEKHDMDELIKRAEEIIRQMNETRRPEEQCERMGNSIRIPRPAARDEPSTSSGLVYDYVPIQNISLYSDNHQNAQSNPIRNLIQLIKTSARNEAITSSTNYEESQDVQRAIEESLRSAQYQNKDIGVENSDEVEPCTSSFQQDCTQEVQMDDSNSLSDAECSQIESTSQVTNGNDRNEANTSHIYSENSHEVQENTSESARHVPQESTGQITRSPTQEEPSSSSTNYEDNEEVQENVDESSSHADQFGNMERVEFAGNDQITSTNHFDHYQEVQETGSEIWRHAEQGECLEMSESVQCDSSSSSAHYDDDQDSQEIEIESSTLAYHVESTRSVTMSPSRNEPCTSSAFFEDYEEIYGSDDEISSYTYQLENTRHVTDGNRHDEPCTSSAYYDNYHKVQEDDDESCSDVDPFENTSQATRRPSQNDPCTSSAYYDNNQEDQSNESKSSTSVDQFVSTTQFNGTPAQIEPGTLSDDYEEYEEVQEIVGMSLRQAGQFGRMEPTASSAPYEVLQEVRENIEGSSSYVNQFERLESHRNEPAYDQPSSSSVYYDEYQEVQQFENTRRSARLPAQYVSSTLSAYYNNYQEVQSNDIGSSGLVDQFEQVERFRRRPAHNHPTTVPVQYYGYQEVRRSVVDSSRVVGSFDNRRKSTRRRTPNVRSISPVYNISNYQQEQRNSSSRRVDQRSRKRPAQNQPSTSSAWSEDNGEKMMIRLNVKKSSLGVSNQEVPRSVPERSRAVRLCGVMERAFDRTLPDNPSTLPVISGVYDPNESVRDYLKRMKTLQPRTPSVRQENHSTRQHGARNSTRNLVQEIEQQYSQTTNQSLPLTCHDDYDNKADNQPVKSKAQNVREEPPKPTKKYERFVVQKRKEHHLTRAKAAELGLTPEGPMKKKPTQSRKRERNDSETSDWTPDKKKKKSGKKNNKKGKK
ncbi:hypothetical protein CAEBREN_07779 [Caenorhabditis brenneri]|uniref:Uncharacterized protein n=1 Tax=Caenorhabditis brenneri TaxID=135651 RepID=G0MYH4_CAEBE|nr:hypothetical protein CAEBREN_07779 [Caenorhabditis brenneri]